MHYIIINKNANISRHPGYLLDAAARPTCLFRRAAAVLFLLSASACGTVQIGADKVAEMALNAVGVKLPEKPGIPAVPAPQKTIKIKLETAKDMNAGEDGKGLSVIFRIYKLKSYDAFLAMPYAAFGSPDKEKESLGTDLLETRELTLAPGQLIDLKESITKDMPYLGMVSLFRTPSPQRWRFAFAAADAEKSGITIGMHTCAMTATAIPPIGISLSESALLSPAKCE